MVEDKIDQLLTDMATVKTKLDVHTADLEGLKKQIEPILFHVNGVRWVFKIGAGIIGVISCLAAVLLLFKK